MSYANVQSLVGLHGSGPVAEKAHKDRGNVREQVKKALLEGKPLTKRLERALFDALCELQEEAKLHTYPVRIMVLLRTLRFCEEEARARVSDLKKPKPEHIEAAFRNAVSLVTVPFSDKIAAGLRLLTVDNLTADERATLYVAAAMLHTLVEIWEEAATKMKGATLTHDDDAILDFEQLRLENIHSVLDVAEKAFDLYREVDIALDQLAQNSDAGQIPRQLIEQDRWIAGSNMASLSSYGFDWQRADENFNKAFGVERADIVSRAQKLANRGKPQLERSVDLLRIHPNHMLLARNILYIGHQQNNEPIIAEVRAHIALTLGIAEPAVYTKKIAGRKPLVDEPHLHLSPNGQRSH